MAVRTTGWKAWCAHPEYGIKRVTADMNGDTLADFAQLPDRGMQALVVFHEDAERKPARPSVWTGRNIYYAAPGVLEPIIGACQNGSELPEGAVVRQGTTIDDATFSLIEDEVRAAVVEWL